MKLIAVLAGLALFSTGTVSAAQAYRGFTIDDSAVLKAPDLEAILAATQEQIDMVHAIGLPPDVLAFVSGVKFELVPPGTFKRPTPGRYSGRKDGTVQVSSAVVRIGHKPVLLHELLHAYHDKQIKQGYRNSEIVGLYKEAQSIPAFAAKSHMMENVQEYFACAATTYLFGVTAQEPFNREKVREHQPRLHEYLTKLFGPTAGTHAGSLTRQP
jgi:hypothetical protein